MNVSLLVFFFLVQINHLQHIKLVNNDGIVILWNNR